MTGVFGMIILFFIGLVGIAAAAAALLGLARPSERAGQRASADNNWQNEQFAEQRGNIAEGVTESSATRKGDMVRFRGFGFFGGIALIVLACLALVGCPQYMVYQQEMAGRAKLAEAQSSRQVAILEAHAKMESAKELAQAEVIRAEGAAKANHILQNSLGGPEGYLRYLQIQAYGDTNAQLIYVPTEGGLPITEAGHLPTAPATGGGAGNKQAK
jgi:hypothetical protein